jgi:drug/metabolite transporter (DMT)-like permease
VGIWSVFNIVLLGLDPWLPSFRELLLDLLGGLLFLVTLVIWYKALHQSEATRVVPLVGALVPIFSFILSYIFLDETLTERQFLAFIILIIGGTLISVKRTRFYFLNDVYERFKQVFGDILGAVSAEYRPTRRLVVNSLAASLLFAAYYVLMKYIYSTQPFIGSFVWSRMGSFLGVLMILFVPYWRKDIIEYRATAKAPKNLGFFLAVRVMASVAFIMLNWAISLGSVALVNSLQGVQYVFLMILVFFLATRYPSVLDEELGGGVLFQKSVGATLVSLGLYMLVT